MAEAASIAVPAFALTTGAQAVATVQQGVVQQNSVAGLPVAPNLARTVVIRVTVGVTGTAEAVTITCAKAGGASLAPAAGIVTAATGGVAVFMDTAPAGTAYTVSALAAAATTANFLVETEAY